jgi:hypothetical protein
MDPEYLSACSQKPTTGPYPEPDESNPYTKSYSILYSHLRSDPSGLFPSHFPINILYAFLISSTLDKCPANLILDLTLRIFLKSINAGTPRDEVT